MSESAEQTLANLQKRATEVNYGNVKVNTRIEEAQKQLQLLREQAQREFGTSDLDELQALLKQRNEANAKILTDAEETVRKGEQALLERQKLLNDIEKK